MYIHITLPSNKHPKARPCNDRLAQDLRPGVVALTALTKELSVGPHLTSKTSHPEAQMTCSYIWTVVGV